MEVVEGHTGRIDTAPTDQNGPKSFPFLCSPHRKRAMHAAMRRRAGGHRIMSKQLSVNCVRSPTLQGVYALNVPHIGRVMQDPCAEHTMAHGHRNVPDPNCPEPQASQQICLMQVTHRDKNIFSPHCFEKVARGSSRAAAKIQQGLLFLGRKIWHAWDD